MSVPLVDLAAQNDPLRADAIAAIARVVESQQFILGTYVEEFERALAETLGSRHVIGVSSGTDAVLLSLMARGIGRGDSVVTTPFSFFATAGAIARVGARPIFADIDPMTFTLDARAALAAVDRTTKAIITVHLFGCPAEVPATSLAVFEDAAQSIGAAKLRGTAGCLSFFPSKNVGAFGDAGAIYSDDDAFADRCALLRTHGGRPKHHHALIGGNFRIDALQAAVLMVKLPYLRAWTEARRANAERYRRMFAAAKVPAELVLPADAPGHVYNQFTVRAPRRDELRDHLHHANIGTAVYYPVPFHLQPCFEELGYKRGAFPHTERAADEVLSLPMYPELTEAQQQYVVDHISSFYA